jgi:hypothetical protein
MEQYTLDFIKSLPLSDDTKMALMSTIEWEIELNWTAGYDAAIIGGTEEIEENETIEK